jgi:hypothetical protein
VTSETHLSFGEGDVLVVDASNQMISGGQTDAGVLRRAFERGASLHSLPALHSKLYLFGRTAVIGSANLSNSRLFEGSLVTRDHVIVAGVASMIDQMVRRARRIDEKFLSRIERIKVDRMRTISHATARGRITDRGNRTWIAAVKELKEGAFPEEDSLVRRAIVKAALRKKDASSEVTWIRMLGNSSFRNIAKEGDSVLQIYTSLGSMRPRVFRSSPILDVQRRPTWTRFYVEAYSEDAEESLSWTEFSQLLRRVGSANISKRSIREIPNDIAQRIDTLWPRRRRG